MSKEIVREWNFWLVSIISGVIMAFTYDVIRLIRRLIRHNKIAVDLEDILYWTACFVFSFTLLYYGNNGVIRFAAVLGTAVGMVIYAVTVGRVFVRTSFLVIDKTIGNLLRGIRKMIQKVRRLLTPVMHFVKRSFVGIFRKIWLTCVAKRHKMKIRNHKKRKGKKGETDNGSTKTKQKKSQKKEKKNATIPPRQE